MSDYDLDGVHITEPRCPAQDDDGGYCPAVPRIPCPKCLLVAVSTPCGLEKRALFILTPSSTVARSAERVTGQNTVTSVSWASLPRTTTTLI